MKKNSIGFVILVGLFLAACAGEKNEAQSDNTILAVRSFETGATGNEAEATEIAVISGAETPEQAQVLAENANWVPVSKFNNSEIDFASPEATQQTSRGDWGCNSCGGNGGGNYHRPPQGGSNHHRPSRPNVNIDVNIWNTYNWSRPTYAYYGSSCGYQYFYYYGQCVVPVSSYYSYAWRPLWGYSMTVSYRPGRPQWHHNRRAYVRFYY